MAPWDPVRDALRGPSGSPQKSSSHGNRPATPSKPLVVIPSQRSVLASPSTSTSTSIAVTSTTPRTSSSLAMLLNDSTTYRSSQSPVLPSASSSARPTLTLSHSSTGLPIDMLVNPVNDSSAHYNNHKATPTRSLPPPPLPQPPMRAPAAAPAIPYNPERITRPGSVLVPLTDAERKTFSNPVNSLRRAVAQNSNRTLDIEESSAQPQSLSSGGYSPSQTQNNEPMMDYDLSRKRKRPHDEALDASPPSKRPKDKDQIAFHC